MSVIPGHVMYKDQDTRSSPFGAEPSVCGFLYMPLLIHKPHTFSLQLLGLLPLGQAELPLPAVVFSILAESSRTVLKQVPQSNALALFRAALVQEKRFLSEKTKPGALFQVHIRYFQPITRAQWTKQITSQLQNTHLAKAYQGEEARLSLVPSKTSSLHTQEVQGPQQQLLQPTDPLLTCTIACQHRQIPNTLMPNLPIQLASPDTSNKQSAGSHLSPLQIQL